MKKLFTILPALALGFGLGTLDSRADNFNITNYIVGGASLISYPTNIMQSVTNAGVWTNTLGQLTGGAVSVANNNFATFDFQCLPNAAAATGACTVTIQLVRAITANPAALQETNGLNTQILQNDWENPTPPYLSLAIPITGTNAINWQTNLLEFALGANNWIGIYSITNATTNSITLTNCAAFLNKKIIPIRYP